MSENLPDDLQDIELTSEELTDISGGRINVRLNMKQRGVPQERRRIIYSKINRAFDELALTKDVVTTCW